MNLSNELRAVSSAAFLSLFMALSGGCRSAHPVPDLAAIYNDTARYHDPDQNPIIVIPGILGSKLVAEDGKVVWGAFGGDASDPSTPAGKRRMSLPMMAGAALTNLVDTTHAIGVLETLEVSLLGFPISLQAYFEILGVLGVGGYRDEELGMSAIDYGDDHFTCFQFGYDWRRDNIENARRLAEFIAEKKKYVAAEIKKRWGVDRDVKFDIIAHSMGGLVARYFLRYGGADLPADGSAPEVTWAGAQDVDRVVMVGTPNAGSAHAVEQLVDGITFTSLFPGYTAAMLGTMPSIYQLMPRHRHGAVRDLTSGKSVSLYDPETWKRFEWGLLDPDEAGDLEVLLPGIESAKERREIAYDHVKKSLERAERFHAALDSKVPTPPNLRLYLIAGDAVQTTATLGVNASTGRLSVLSSAPGDETVTRASALLDERVGGEWRPKLVSPIAWHDVTFIFNDHLGLTRDPGFTDNVLYILLEDPR